MLAPLLNFTASADEVSLSQQMVAYWTNFAHSTDPNQGGPAQPQPSVPWPVT